MISARKAKHLEATTMFTYSHANTPLSQSERAYYLSYFIKYNAKYLLQDTVIITQNVTLSNVYKCKIQKRNKILILD